MIMTLTMFVGLAFFILSLGTQKLLIYLEQKPQVVAFFKDTITSQEQLAQVRMRLEETGKVAKIRFVSKEQALEIYRERHKSDPLLLELVTANTLPASLEVSAKNVAELPTLYEILKQAPDLEDIAYQKDIVDNLIVALDNVRGFGLGLLIFLSVTALFTILTVIGMKIALRKDEIGVERLVGASKWYIRWPFLLEGLFYGASGAIVSWGVMYLLILVATPYLLPYLSGLSLLPVSPIFMVIILGAGLLVGGLVGVVGSFLAVWRYLRD